MLEVSGHLHALAALLPGEKPPPPPCSHSEEGLVDPRASLDDV
jgi:hypothetical protein